MKIEKVRLDKYGGPYEDSVTVGNVYEVTWIIDEDDGEYVILDDDHCQQAVSPDWCTVIQDEFGVRDLEEQSLEYSGEGLPPVGTVCEILGTSSGSWSEGVIDYIDSKHCIWHWLDGGQETMHNRVCNMQFRPIKSEKQKEIDKIASELLESVNKHGQDFKHLEGPIAEHLYNAGLRFTKDSK